MLFRSGASGYGTRKAKENGVLRYSSGRVTYYDPESSLVLRPLFYDIYRRPGAVYWVDKPQEWSDGTWTSSVSGFDFNYFTFDFSPIFYSNVFSNQNSNASFIRCID